MILRRFFIHLKVYRYLKTVIIMPIETRFKCTLGIYSLMVSNNNKKVIITFEEPNTETDIVLDIPTAIKLSKTIRTHINLVKSEQDGNR